MHVDDFIDSHKTNVDVSWFLMLKRLSAGMKLKFKKHIDTYQLLCTFKGEQWYIIGASTLGDVWLSKNGKFPYDKRVDIEECSDFILKH